MDNAQHILETMPIGAEISVAKKSCCLRQSNIITRRAEDEFVLATKKSTQVLTLNELAQRLANFHGATHTPINF